MSIKQQATDEQTNNLTDTDNSVVLTEGEVGGGQMKRLKKVKYVVTEESGLWVVSTHTIYR